jgi:hypothetical protein
MTLDSETFIHRSFHAFIFHMIRYSKRLIRDHELRDLNKFLV